MDEWEQLVAMRVITVYVRRCFSKPGETSEPKNSADSFYTDSGSASSNLDPDLELLFKCALQLLHSRSNAVYPSAS